MAGNLALYPVCEDGARQVDLGEIVEAENAIVFGFRSHGKGMQPATAGVAQYCVQSREAIEGFLNYSTQCRGIGNVG